MNAAFWQGKKVFLTGHTGFKGAWLALWLQELGAEVTGFSLAPPTDPSLFELASVADGMVSLEGDIRDIAALQQALADVRPDIVLHLAAQSLVRPSYKDPIETYSTNVMGSLNVLEAVRQTGGVRAVVMVTTDKCYENKERPEPYSEGEPLGGYDPYSSSKACMEILTASYRNSFFPADVYARHQTAVASARAGNVIGGGDWATDRLLPDVLAAFEVGKPAQIRNPNAIRPWQHVLEPLHGYLLLAEQLFENGSDYAEAWNFGPDDSDTQTVGWIVEQLAETWSSDASWEIDAGDHPHEANILKLDSTKARTKLQWQPRWSLQIALQRIAEWHSAYIAEADMRTCCIGQINSYLNDAPDAQV